MIFTKPAHRKVAAPAPGGAQLAGCLSIACPDQNETQGLMPGDGVFTFNASASIQTVDGRRAFNSTISRGADGISYPVSGHTASRYAFMVWVHADMDITHNVERIYSSYVNGSEECRRIAGSGFTNSFNQFRYVRRNTADVANQTITSTNVANDKAPSNAWFAEMYMDDVDGTGSAWYLDAGDGNPANVYEYILSRQDPWSGTIRQPDTAYILNTALFDNSLLGSVAEVRVYDLDQIDPSYATPQELFAEVNSAPVYP